MYLGYLTLMLPSYTLSFLNKNNHTLANSLLLNSKRNIIFKHKDMLQFSITQEKFMQLTTIHPFESTPIKHKHHHHDLSIYIYIHNPSLLNSKKDATSNLNYKSL